MQYIKLDAIPSTNDFLKEYVKKQNAANFTTVVAKNQTKGKGQMGTVWKSQEGKNLTMSIYIADVVLQYKDIFVLNKAVTVAVIEVLRRFKISNLSIKWPNDIMAENKKIGGILIENVYSAHNGIYSIIGIGINVNQTIFENLPQAASLATVSGQFFDLEELLVAISENVKQKCKKIPSLKGDFHKIEEDFWNNLFKKQIPMPFEDKNGIRFMGIIRGVSANGQLQVVLEDDSICSYGIKEIKMLF